MSGKLRTTLALGLLWTTLTGSAIPASATVYDTHATMHFGRIDLQTQTIFGTINIDIPGSGVPGCEADVSFRARFDDVAGTVSNASLSMNLPFTLPVFGGTYEFEASSTSVSSGTWNPTTGNWTGVRMDISLEVYTFNPTGCTRMTPVCRANFDMEFFGTTKYGDEGPIPELSGPVWFDATTERRITVGSGCAGIWNTIMPGTDFRIEDNPLFPNPAGAEFR